MCLMLKEVDTATVLARINGKHKKIAQALEDYAETL